MKKKNNSTSFFTVLFAFVMGGVLMLGILKWTPVLDEVVGNGTNKSTIIDNKTQVYEKTSLAASVDKIKDAVMTVNGYTNGQLASTGTAFVYKKDDKYGYLLTNNHVIANMNEIKVINTNEETAEAKVLGGDQYLDLAVLRIDLKYVHQIAKTSTSEKVKVGDTVFAIGTPMGNDYKGSVTSGILSGRDRTVSVATSSYNSNDWVMQVLQIDASLNPGNSGGPLANINGEVIGICSMKLVDDEIEGMGFAIPIEYALGHVDSLENGKKIEWPVLGIQMTDTYQGSFYNAKKTKGITVVNTTSGSGAEKAGIKAGDIITKLDGVEVEDVAHLRFELYKHKVGDTIELTYLRDEKEHKTKVTLTK